MNEKGQVTMISEKAESISERIYDLVEEYDEDFKVWNEVLLYLVGENILSSDQEEQVLKLAKFKEDLDRYIGSFIQI